MIDVAFLNVLEELGSCGTSDVLDRLRLGDRWIDRLGPVTVPGCVAGVAVTTALEPMLPGEPRPPVHLGARAIDAADARSVIVMALDGDEAISGLWGDLLSLAAQVKGVRATVVGGRCRDTDAIRELGYPVFATGTIPASARGRVKEVAVGVPVELDGVRIEPGDVIVSDGDGAVVVPAGEVGRVRDTAEAMLAAEAEITAGIRAGTPLSEILGAGYESMTQDPS